MASVRQEFSFRSLRCVGTPQPVEAVMVADWWVSIDVLSYTTARNSLWVNYRHPAKWGGGTGRFCSLPHYL